MPNSTGTAAASSKDNPSGTGQALRAGTLACSACEPCIIMVVTRWPTWKPSTPSPVSLTTPLAW